MLETLDLKKKLTKEGYKKEIVALQARLRGLQYEAREAEIPIIICIEGWDTAGKGKVISKLTEKLDPRLFRVLPGRQPSKLERRFHFLWRYQTVLPNDGEMAVFDHSWYGRVLVERCDGLVKKKVWRSAYQQINEFERWLVDDGQVLLKFWLHISKREQKQRFKACLDKPLRRWKITEEYERHHRQYGKWLVAVEEMMAKTSTPHAPWTIVEAEDVRWARVKVFETVVNRVDEAVARRRAAPTEVSRTRAARDAMKAVREAQAVRDVERAKEEERQTAAAAGAGS